MSNPNSKGFFNDFKAFISKGNVVDLAVALVVGAAFNKIVSQLVESFINPLIGIFTGGINMSELCWYYEPVYEDGVLVSATAIFSYGLFLQAIIDFLIISLTVFLIVKLYTRFKARAEKMSQEWYDELYPEEAKKRKAAEEEAKRKEEEAKRIEAEQQAEIERLKKEKEEAQREYFLTQQKLLTEIRDALKEKQQ